MHAVAVFGPSGIRAKETTTISCKAEVSNKGISSVQGRAVPSGRGQLSEVLVGLVQ